MSECFTCGYVGDDFDSHSAHLSHRLAGARSMHRALLLLLVSHRLHLEAGFYGR